MCCQLRSCPALFTAWLYDPATVWPPLSHPMRMERGEDPARSPRLTRTVPASRPGRDLLPHCAAGAGETGAAPAAASILFASTSVAGAFGIRGRRVEVFLVALARVRADFLPASTRLGSFARARAFDVTVTISERR